MRQKKLEVLNLLLTNAFDGVYNISSSTGAMGALVYIWSGNMELVEDNL